MKKIKTFIKGNKNNILILKIGFKFIRVFQLYFGLNNLKKKKTEQMECNEKWSGNDKYAILVEEVGERIRILLCDAHVATNELALL